ncbi:MAG: hypothetical protein J7M40_01810, partial [Planctomycetes bacterium]|nr:hypothetical protein [Planctomycetota bacterium]
TVGGKMRIDKHISNIFGAEVTGRGPPRTTRKTASGKVQRLTNFGERTMPSINKKQIVRFSAPPILNKHTRGPPPKRR